MTTTLISILAALIALDGLRLRKRVAAIATLPASDVPTSPQHVFLTTPGVTVDDATRRAASAHALAEGLDVLDLVPGDWPALSALGFAQLVDPRTYRENRLARGRTAGHAILVSRAVLERAGLHPERLVLPPVDLVRAVVRLKHYASRTTDVAVAPTLLAVPEDPTERYATLREVLGGALKLVLFGQPLMLAVLAASVWASPIAGAAFFLAWTLQPLLALAGLSVQPKDLLAASLCRAGFEAVAWGRLVGSRRRDERPDPVEVRRPIYDALLAEGTERFFGARREDCPICGSARLVKHLTVPDLLQHKPGRFTLERCEECRHVFQNPRLTVEGLDFYYKDFYDGLGEEGLAYIFGYSADPYFARAALVASAWDGAPAPTGADGPASGRRSTGPHRWLDVGCGHGHFSCVARDAYPGARFDGIDLSESIEEAVRRGWVDQGHRGLFPEVATTFAARYDAVVMSHYLEHTTDPRREIEAANVALADGGALMIEVPNPDSFLGKGLGRLWLPWFQPQHLHFVSMANMERLLREAGFEPIRWHLAESHQRVDFFLGAILLLGRIAPPPDQPWRPRPTWVHRAWRTTVWTLGLPVIFLARTLDRWSAPLVRRVASNTYRVLARKTRALATAPLREERRAA